MSFSKLPSDQILSLKPHEQPEQPLARGAEDTTLRVKHFKGLPEGSTVAQVVRCVQLLEHIPSCGGGGGCPEGEGCRRLKQILTHHDSCRRRRGATVDCSICQQLLALCHVHSRHCQAGEGTCKVLYCKNKKVSTLPDQNESHPIPASEERARIEHQYKLKKLSETIVLLKKQQKLWEIKRLLETNQQVASQILQSVFGKKCKSHPSLGCEMKNQTILKSIKSGKYKSQRAMHSNIFPQVLSCMLELNILVKAPSSSTQTCTDVKG